MKKHNLIKVVLIAILVMFLLTWILPITSFQYGEISGGVRQQMGLFELFSYPALSVSFFGTLFMFIVAVGAFYGVLSKTGVYRTLLDKIVKGFKGKESIFLIVIMILITVITSVSGLNYAMLFVFPFVIALVLAMGYNKLTAATVTVGSLLIGIMGTTFGTANIPYISDILSTSAYTEITTKVLILVIGLVLLIFNVLRYAKHDKVDSDLVEEGLLPDKDKSKKHIWPAVVVFDLVLLVMILAIIPWENVFKIDLFTTVTKAVTEFKLFGFPIAAKLLGNVAAFGTWTMSQLPMLVIMATGVLGLVYRVKFSEFIEGIINGLKKAVGPAAIAMLIYTVLIIATYNPFQLTIIKFLMTLTKGFNVVTLGASEILASIFNIDMMYVAQGTLPYIISVITDNALFPLIGVMYQSLYAFAMLFAPTSIVLMTTLAYLKVPYGKWLKHIWKLLLELFIILFVIFTIILLV
ncbi:MAG: SLC13 family permease [Bacilli bacterium]